MIFFTYSLQCFSFYGFIRALNLQIKTKIADQTSANYKNVYAVLHFFFPF